MKKQIKLLMSVALLATCTACSEESATVSTEESLLTATVQVVSMDGNAITVETGTVEEQEMQGQPMGEAPQKPEGEAPQGEQAPDQPEGEAPQGEQAPDQQGKEAQPSEEAPQKPEGEAPQSMNVFVGDGSSLTVTVDEHTTITVEFLQGQSDGTIEDIAVGSVLDLVYDQDGLAKTIVVKNLNAGNGFGGSDTVENGTAVTTIDTNQEIAEEEYMSSGDDENALRVDGAEVQLSNVEVLKTGGESSNTENGDFYGANAGLLALDGATVTIEDSTFETNAVNGNAVFSYGSGTTVRISNSSIRTTMRNSGGLQTTGGATMEAENLDVVTEGDSSAAIRSDRGGGTVYVKSGNYVTYGTGSPAVYSTADITVEDATLTANASEGVVVEGKNSVTLNNCTLIGSMQSMNEEENVHGVMIYQSMSGDADLGEASFTAKNGSISTTVGDLFYVTNTDCVLSLEHVTLTLANDTLLTIAGNTSSRGWGTKGANGGDVKMNCIDQTLEGKISVDSISSLDLNMEESTFTGSINEEQEGGEVTVTMDETSTWTLTADSYISAFNGDLTQVNTNGFKLYVDGEPVVE